MADDNPFVPQNQNTNRSSKTTGILAIVLACAASVAPFTMSKEGTIYKAYQDPVGIWTICDGHTGGVYKGQVATKAQCKDFFQNDMKDAMLQDLKYTPTLIQNQSALKAAGDLTFNGGIGSYVHSPIRKYFDKGKWVEGCNAFVGWWDTASSSKPLRNTQCTYQKDRKKWSCRLPGLVSRRIGEKNICLGHGDPVPSL